jgi:hypothetical protein
MKTGAPFVTVPKLFSGETFACVGTGPSVTQEDVNYLMGRARVIVVNHAYKLAPWADVLYAADSKWWRWEAGAPTFKGLKFTIEPQPEAWPDLRVLRNTGRNGLELNPNGLRTGLTSGYQAIGLAVHFGAKRIILLGYDMHGDHFFGSYQDKSKPPFFGALASFQTIVEPLKDAGVEVINCTPDSALKAFPCAPLRSVLAGVAA